MKTKLWSLLGTFILTTAAHAVPVVIQVTGPNNLPVAGAEVRTARQPDADASQTSFGAPKPLYETARTDAKGVASFDWAEPKKPAGKSGDALQYLGAATVWATGLGATNLTLHAGNNQVQLLKPVGIARGMVRDEKGAPVAGVKVGALGLTNTTGMRSFAEQENFAVALGDAAFSALSDDQGRWQIGNLPIGARANVRLVDSALAPDKATAPILEVTSPALTAAPESAPKEINGNGVLRAVPASSLTGRVLDDKGAAVAGVTVWASIEPSPDDFPAPVVATTDAQGEYRLNGLAAGSYLVLMRAPQTSPLVADAKAMQKIELASGQNQTLPPQSLIAGGTLEVQVNDAADGKPLPNMRVSMSRKDSPRAEWTFPLSGLTDQNGQMKMQLAPDQYDVSVHGDSSGYISPRTTLTRDGGDEPLTIATGKTEHKEWKLSRGLSASGRIIDEAGNALPNIALSLVVPRDGDDMFNNIMVQSNALGEWQENTFQAGQYKISANYTGVDQSPEWEIVSPQNFAVPTRGPITIVLKPIAKTTLSGRVIDTDGAGVANARIVAKIANRPQDFRTSIEREAFSDAQGNYTLPAFPVTAQSIALSVERAGYISNKLPQAQNDANVWSSSDAVLQALSSHLGGTIVNAQNEPQSAVQVLAPRFGTSTISDETGAWKIDDLAPGDTEIVAVGKAGAVVQNVIAEQDEVTLKLRPYVIAAPRDIEGAKAILEEAWQTARGSKFTDPDSLPATLAPYDPDVALAMARDRDVKDEETIVAVVRALAAQDAERARQWAPQVLATLKTPESQMYAGLYLAQSLVDKHPDDAKIWLQKSSALLNDVKITWKKRDLASKIAVLSAQLKLPDAQQRFEQALQLAGPQPDAGYNFYPWLAWRVSRINAEWAKQTVAAAIKDAPNQKEGPETTISYAIRRLAPWNLEVAQQMLDQYGDLKGSYGLAYEMDEAKSTVLIERLKQNGDVDAALKSAHDQGYLLTRIADLAPVERRAEILRDALQALREANVSRSVIIDTARELLPYDREFARSTLDEIAQSFEIYDTDRDRYSRSRDVAAWAFAYRGVDPSPARWQLEREWARQINQIQLTPIEQRMRSNQIQSLILAMATLDVERAKQMIFALPVDEEGGAPFVAARTLSRWLLASEEERQNNAFAKWFARNQDDDFSQDN